MTEADEGIGKDTVERPSVFLSPDGLQVEVEHSIMNLLFLSRRRIRLGAFVQDRLSLDVTKEVGLEYFAGRIDIVELTVL